MSSVDDELEEQLRTAFAYRAEHTTVTDRAFGERNLVTEMAARRHPKPRAAAIVGLAAAVIVAVGVTVAVSRSGEDAGVVLVPYSDDVEPGAFVDANATYLPEGFSAYQDPHANVLACGAWTETAGGPRCDRVVGETSLLYQTADFSQTIQVTVMRELGIPSPRGAPDLEINGHEAWYVGDTGFETLTWEVTPGIWIDIAADDEIDEAVVLDVARGIEATDVEWTGGPLALVVERVAVPDLAGGTLAAGISALVSDETTCVFMVPTGFCEPITLDGAIAVGESAVDQYVLGLVAPDVAGVEVELLGGQRVPATLHAISGSDLRVFSLIDPGAEVVAVHAIDAADAAVGSTDLMPPGVTEPLDAATGPETTVPAATAPITTAPATTAPATTARGESEPALDGELTWGTDWSMWADGACVHLTQVEPACLGADAPAAIAPGRGFIFGIVDSSGARIEVNGVAVPAEEVYAYEGRTYFLTSQPYPGDARVIIWGAGGEILLDRTLPGFTI